MKREDPDKLIIDNTRQLYINFTMPMFILAIRVNIEMIFKKNYVKFFSKKQGADADSENSQVVQNQNQAMRLINGTITEVLDPNIFYSRLSFLESGKDALDIKSNLNQGKQHNGYKLPNIQNKFYTRSALIRNLIPLPSEGKVRA